MKRIASLVALISVSACGPIPTMIMPDKLESTGDVYEVSGANGSILPSLIDQEVSFGPYKASVRTSGERSKVSGPTSSNGGQEIRQLTQRARFTLRGGRAGSWKGTCTSITRKVMQYEMSFVRWNRKVRTDVEPVVTEDRHWQHCDVQNLAVGNAKVTLNFEAGDVASGSVESGFGVWALWSSTEQRDQPFGPTAAGITFRDPSGTAIAALDTGGRKRIAFRKDLENAERALVAAVSVTILLQRFLQ